MIRGPPLCAIFLKNGLVPLICKTAFGDCWGTAERGVGLRASVRTCPAAPAREHGISCSRMRAMKRGLLSLRVLSSE